MNRPSTSGDGLHAFRRRITTRSAVVRRIRQKLGNWLLKNSLPVFLRGGDSITLDPLVNGYWEPVLTEFITNAARAGYDGFFLDIGANIGLTSCQCGNAFREVCMFEPNPEIFPILELNTRLVLGSGRRRAFNYGLGPESTTARLNVPNGNWGGAFVHDRHNAYSDELFAERHRVGRLDLGEYRQLDVRIVASADVIPGLFADFAREGRTRGVIKLDTEGYEKPILESLAPHVPADFALVVVFENWDAGLDLQDLAARFDRPVTALRLVRRPRERGALWRDLPFMLPLGGMCFTVENVAPGSGDGDLVFIVDPRSGTRGAPDA